MKIVKTYHFSNGVQHIFETNDFRYIETTDTFLPIETINGINYDSKYFGNRSQRWMIGVSTAIGCPVGCKFCATGDIKRYRNLEEGEIMSQILRVISNNKAYFKPENSLEFKINYTRMGEPFLNIKNVKSAIKTVNTLYPNTHQYISTIGLEGSDFSWIKDNITLQISLHSLDEKRRNKLIPYKNKLSIEELGKIRTKSNKKTTLNLTLVDIKDFDIEKLVKYFDPEHFFIKLSPINDNEVARKNNVEIGVIKQMYNSKIINN